MLLASVFAVLPAGVLVHSLQLGGDDVHTDELLVTFVWILTEVFLVRHAAAEGTCEFIDNDIDHCTIWNFRMGLQSIKLI